MRLLSIFVFFLFSSNRLFGQNILRPCRDGELWGYCDENGKYKINPQFQKALQFETHLAPVVPDDNYWWYINKKGDLLFNTKRWADQRPLLPEKGLYKVEYFDPIFANVVEYYNKYGLPVKVRSESDLNADTLIYSVFNIKEASALAKSKLGVQYGIDSLDCSGFIRFIYKPFGITLPYFAREIGEKGREVSIKDAKPGDLIFFIGSNLSDKTINHVGMILAVKGKEIEFIHSSTSKGITINKSTDSYYKARFLFVRRIFG